MPLYEYFCSDCRTTFESLRSISQADAENACPRCHGIHTERTISLFAAQVVPSKMRAREPVAGGCPHCGAPEPGMCGGQN